MSSASLFSYPSDRFDNDQHYQDAADSASHLVTSSDHASLLHEIPLNCHCPLILSQRQLLPTHSTNGLRQRQFEEVSFPESLRLDQTGKEFTMTQQKKFVHHTTSSLVDLKQEQHAWIRYLRSVWASNDLSFPF